MVLILPLNEDKLFIKCKKRQVNVLLLQETHFKSDFTPSCANRYFNMWIHSTHTSQKARGVSVAAHKTPPFTNT